MSLGRILLWLVGGTSAVALALTGIIGFAHTPPGRPLLKWIPGMGDDGCPIPDVTLTPEQRDEARATSLVAVAGTAASPAQPALAWSFGTTSRADVERDVAAHGVACEATSDHALRCTQLPATLAGGMDADTALFEFDAKGRLITIDLHEAVPDAAAAVLLHTQRRDALAAEVGPPTSQRGEPDAAWIAGAPLRIAAASFRFSDFRAEIETAHLGHERYRLRDLRQAFGAAKP